MDFSPKPTTCKCCQCGCGCEQTAPKNYTVTIGGMPIGEVQGMSLTPAEVQMAKSGTMPPDLFQKILGGMETSPGGILVPVAAKYEFNLSFENCEFFSNATAIPPVERFHTVEEYYQMMRAVEIELQLPDDIKQGRKELARGLLAAGDRFEARLENLRIKHRLPKRGR